MIKNILKSKGKNLKFTQLGFTLIELTAVIVVLASIFLVSFPALLNIARSDEEKKYDNMIEDLCLAGKSYMYANMDSYSGLSTVDAEIEIVVSELMIYGNVDKNLINPKTEESVENNKLIYTVLSDYSLDCQYIEN